MVTVTFEGNTVEEVVEAIRRFDNQQPWVTMHVNTKMDAKLVPTPSVAQSVPESAPAKSPIYTSEDVQKAVSKLVAHIGRENTVKLLAECNAKKGSDLTEATRPVFMAKANAALDGPKVEKK